MIKLKVNMPWSVIWHYEVSAIPRLGEHIQIRGVIYMVVEIRHVPEQNHVFISIRNADGAN